MPRKKDDRPLAAARRRLTPERTRLKRRAARRGDIEKYQPRTIDLKYVHSINGVQYAGRCRVRADVAAVLLEQDQRADATESVFQSKRAGLIRPGGRTVMVDYDTFDASFANAAPIAIIG